MTPLRVLMLGTPTFAVPTLEALLASPHEVVGLVCQPDRPRGRGQKVLAPPTKSIAEARGMPVFQPLRLRDKAVMQALGDLRADIGVVAAYGHILPDALIELPARGMINVHASLLPRYRGAAPIQRAVMAGDDATGVTIMRVVRELDAGPMLAAATLPIDADATSVEVERALAVSGAELLVATLDRLASGEAVPEIPQDDRLATYAAKIERADGLIDWTRPARDIHNQVRGLHPWPHAFTYLEGARVLIHRTSARDAEVAVAAPHGTLLAAGPEGIDVATGGGVLRVVALQPEGKRVMPARAWLAGHRPPNFRTAERPNLRFSTP
ncbi:MAG TPA: methionyl-tRNA formyltransferase [Vicinamibacterales bacterium]|nr:methionyl-tRNA formyltransferase [Vicinamibacterales bacterium]